MSADLALLIDAAREAGALAQRKLAEGIKVWEKAEGSPVTDADIAVDRLLYERLTAARPDYGWLSEETADDPSRMSRTRVFVVDPIDGTVAFFKNKPWWTVCVAVVEDGQPIAGVVFAPALDELYSAALGQGAHLNGVPLCASGVEALEDAAVLGDARLLSPPAWPLMRVASRNSVAYRMCLVAAGAFDGAIAPTPKNEWDLAAADLIAAEAGARSTDGLGRMFTYNQPDTRRPSLVCAGPGLHQLILNRLGTNSGREPPQRTSESPKGPMPESQLLHIVIGGELEAVDVPRFRDLKNVEFVGAFPNYAEAHTAWKAKAQQTVDNALMRYFVIHAHKLLEPDHDHDHH